MNRRLILIVLALVLALTSCGDPTGPTKGPKAPATNKLPKDTCNPHSKPYCFHDPYAKAAREALAWAAKHKDAKEREPAHFPTGLTKLGLPAYHVVYVVTFKPNGGGDRQVWKYGLTEQQPWYRRSQSGIRDCQKSWMSAGPCTDNWVAVTEADPGLYRARFLEAALVKQWNLIHAAGIKTGPGRCPPGQDSSCR